MAAIELKVPDIGGSAAVIEFLVKEGDTVANNQGLLTLESDKATMEVEAVDAPDIQVKVLGEGEGEVSTGEQNLIVKALLHTFVKVRFCFERTNLADRLVFDFQRFAIDITTSFAKCFS